MWNFNKNMLVLGAALMTTQLAQAEGWPSNAEMAALPPYCAAKYDEAEGRNPEQAKVWSSTMGLVWTHIHHYCFGLNFVNRARSTFSSRDNNMGTLGAAMRNFDYVLSAMSGKPEFYLHAEIMMNRGIALSMMKRNGEAVSSLLKAIELDAKQVGAYIALAELYDKMKNRSKALETVTEGLRHNPDSKAMQRHYLELGGKKPFPEPFQSAEQDGTSRKEVNSKADPVTAGSNAATGPQAQPVTMPEPEPVQTEIGMPGNPYCRFCPTPAAEPAH